MIVFSAANKPHIHGMAAKKVFSRRVFHKGDKHSDKKRIHKADHSYDTIKCDIENLKVTSKMAYHEIVYDA